MIALRHFVVTLRLCNTTERNSGEAVVHCTMCSRQRRTFEIWTLIQDLIGKASLWPYQIRRLFWTKNLTNFQRMLITVFSYVNGLPLETLQEWCDHMGLCRDEPARRHIGQLWNYFNRGRYGHLYSYNVTMNRYHTVGGDVRHYINRMVR